MPAHSARRGGGLEGGATGSVAAQFVLFEFRLRPLRDIAPWGTPDDLSLHWFGLTDGCYRINAGAESLLSYAPDYMARFPGVDPFAGSRVAYQVVRLWEDLLGILPDVPEPLPDDFCNLLERDYIDFEDSYRRAVSWIDRHDDGDAGCASDLFEAAMTWRRDRVLDSAYLRNAARIWSWDDVRSAMETVSRG